MQNKTHFYRLIAGGMLGVIATWSTPVRAAEAATVVKPQDTVENKPRNRRSDTARSARRVEQLRALSSN